MLTSQVSSTDMPLAHDAIDCKFESHQYQCSRENWVCLNPLDKELTTNCLVATHMKFWELILAVMVSMWSLYEAKIGTLLLGTQWSAGLEKNVYFLGSWPIFPQFVVCFYEQKTNKQTLIKEKTNKQTKKQTKQLQIPKFPFKDQYFPGRSFPNSPFSPIMKWSVNICKVTVLRSHGLQNQGGIVHYKSPAFLSF